MRNQRDSAPVHAFTLKNSRFSLEIPDMGHHHSHHRGGSMRDVMPALTDLAAYEVSGWWICPIGRYANRLKGGIPLDGCHYPPAQETERHGPAWRARPVLGRTPVGLTAANRRAMTLRLVSPDGDQDFPGAMTVEVDLTG